MIQTAPRTILEVFESLPEGTRCELISKQIVMSPSPTFGHQNIALTIATQLKNFVDKHELGVVVIAPMDVYFGKENVFQPDILFVTKERLDIIKDEKIKGAPALIVEVLSPGTKKLDKKNKKAVYEQFGVKEYWIVEPQSKKTTGFKLENNEYVEIVSSKSILQLQLLQVTLQF